MKDSLKIAVVGATGYVGLQLIKILSKHPRAKIIYLCAKKSIGKNQSMDIILVSQPVGPIIWGVIKIIFKWR